jgi:hypothetical protein
MSPSIFISSAKQESNTPHSMAHGKAKAKARVKDGGEMPNVSEPLTHHDGDQHDKSGAKG